MKGRSGKPHNAWSIRVAFVFSSILMLGIGAGVITPASTAAQELDEHAQRRLERLWKAQWRNFADEYYLYDGQGHVLLNYERGSDNSLPYTKDALKKQTLHMNWTQRQGRVYLDKTKDLPPHDDDVAYALNVLPRIARGHFGHILSAQVTDKLDPQTVRITDIRYIDANALDRERVTSLYKVRRESAHFGNTLNVSPDQINDFMFRYRIAISRLPSKPLVITGLTAEQMPLVGGQLRGPIQLALFDRGRGLEAVPLENVEIGLSEAQFIAMLEARGKSKEEFAMVIAEGLDRGLPIKKLQRAVRRYLEDYEPEQAASRLAAAETKTQVAAPPAPEPAASAEDPTPDRVAPATPAEPEPSAQTTTAAVEKDPRNHRPPKTTETYFDDLWEDAEPDTNASIFDFGRDL